MKNILMVIPSKKDLRWSDQPQLEKNLMLSKQPLYQVMENLNKSKIMYERGQSKLSRLKFLQLFQLSYN